MNLMDRNNGSLENKTKSQSVLLGLLGYPLGHSISPVLHKTAGEVFGIDIDYHLFEVKEIDLEDALRGLRALGFTGCNVTIPYKERVIKYVDEKSEVVEFLGACNTLSFRGRKTFGDNTDWAGFLQDWKDNEMGDIAGKRGVILGSGGAASAVVYALVQSGIEEIWLFNRHKERGEELSKKFRDKYPKLKARAYSLGANTQLNQAMKSFDILINTTPVGMFPNTGELPVRIPQLINPNLKYYDLIYNPQKTKMAEELEKQGVKVCGGIGMLVHQAALAFKRWLGLEPNTGLMLQAAQESVSIPVQDLF